MNKKKIILTLLTLSLLGSFCGYLTLQFNLQPNDLGDLFVKLGKAAIYGCGALALTSLILFIIPRAFDAWKKFAIWFLPLAALLFIFYPYPSGSDLFSPYPEQIYRWVSGLYVLISFVIIATHATRTATVHDRGA
jgi:hypothetical protein